MVRRPWLRAPLPLLLVGLVLLAGGASVMVPRGSAAPQLAGDVLPIRPAADFQLRDQWGRVQSLARWRGHPVILTFTQATCAQLCPVVAETIRRSLAELGSKAGPVIVLAVSADPEHDTPAAVRRFLTAHGALYRWHYLTGTRAQLRPIWNAYHLFVAPANAPAKLAQAHTSATFLVDAAGRERVLMGGDPATPDLVADLSVFLGLPAAVHGSTSVAAPEVDHAAPALALPSLAGGTVSLASLRGKVVLLNFWATWCTDCQTEIPRLSRWYRRLRTRGVVVLGVDVQEERAAVAAYARKYHISYPVLLDHGGAVTARYDVVGLPKSLLIDQQGVVQSVKLGVLTSRDLADRERALLAGPG